MRLLVGMALPTTLSMKATLTLGQSRLGDNLALNNCLNANIKVKYEEMRPRAKVVIPFTDLDLGMDIMVNYNMEEPEERGW